jgi:hypothetical protein
MSPVCQLEVIFRKTRFCDISSELVDDPTRHSASIGDCKKTPRRHKIGGAFFGGNQRTLIFYGDVNGV